MLSHRNLIVTAPERDRARGPSRDRRGRRLPAHGVDRRPHVLVRPVDRRRLHDQLPGERGDGAARPPGDRADLLLRAAADLGEHPHHGHDPRSRTRPGPSGAWSASSSTWPGGSSGGASAGQPVPLGDRAALRRSAGCSSTARCGTTSGMRRIRLAYTAGEAIGPGALRVLPRARRQREAALRHDRVERPDLHPAGRRGQARHGGHAAARRRGPDQRVRRGAVPEPRASSPATTRTRRPPGRRSRTAGSTRGRRVHRPGRPPQIIDRARTWAGSRTARSSRPSTSRTS